MRHPTEGVLRRLLDEPAGVADQDRRHVIDCPQCLRQLLAVREDAELVGAALAPEGGAEVNVSAAWQRLSTAGSSAASSSAPPMRAEAPARAGGSRAFLRRPATAVLAVTVVLAGAGTAAANDWLQIFRTEKVAPLNLSTGDLVALPDLIGYGDLEVAEELDVRQVSDARAAAAQTGLDVPEVADLPRGVTGEPAYRVGKKVSATFTFSTERAEATAAEAGETLPTPPAGLDGSKVRLDAGPGVVQTWSSSSQVPALVVGRAHAPTAFSSGVPFETVRDYLLSLPGLSEEVAAQLRTFAADGSTLPLPVPADEVRSSPADVNGAPATVLTTRDRTMAAVVWVEDGMVTAVAGSLDADEVLEVARNLR